MSTLLPGQNPRDHIPNHRERGPKLISFTYDDLAAASGYARGSCQQMSGQVKHLTDLAMIVVRGMARGRSKEFTRDRYVALFSERYIERWEKRWPRFCLYTCAVADCPVPVVNGKGLCRRHSRVGGAMVLDKYQYFALRVEGSVCVPYHRLVVGCPDGMDVHHKDYNKWNNRPENLQVLTHAEHMALHALW